MGTNYYAIPKIKDKEKIKLLIDEERVFDLYELLPERVHIGKSSVGWEFCFDHNNWEYFDKNESSVRKFINGCVIVNEYDEIISQEEFWNLVESKKGMLNHSKYMEKWPKMHPGEPKPFYHNDQMDFLVGELRFHSRTDFS